jgi:hypothetical protein
MTFEAIMNALNDVYSAAENFADRQRERERAAALATPSIGHNRGPALDDEAA